MKKVRQIVIKRDKSTCRLCQSHNMLELHHIVFKSHGGKDTEQNLITLCRACHTKAHDNEKDMRDLLLGLQSQIYGLIKESDLKKMNKWEVIFSED